MTYISLQKPAVMIKALISAIKFRTPSASIVENDARVMAKGQVTIPKRIRGLLGIKPSDRVTFIVDGNTIRVENSAVLALHRFQEQMRGKAAAAELFSEEDVNEWLSKYQKNIRYKRSSASSRRDSWKCGYLIFCRRCKLSIIIT